MSHFLVCSWLLALMLVGCRVQSAISNPDFENLEPPGRGKTYFVSGTGDDRHSGLSPSRAFRTLQRAADLTRPGDTVLVMDGVYTAPGSGSVVLFIENSGEPGNWIRYKAFPGHKPHIKVEQHWAGITVGGADYILVEGFTVEGDAPNVSLAYAREQMSNIENPITSGSCIAVRRHYETKDRPHHVIIRKNHAYHCPGGGIESMEADYLRFEDNLVHHNGFYTPFANSGISMYLNWNSDNSTAIKMFIRRNISYNNENKIPNYYTNPTNISLRFITDGNGIIVDDTRNKQNDVPTEPYLGGTLVENNLTYDNGGRGILVYLSDNVVIRGNTSYHNARTNTENFKSDWLINDAANVNIYGNIIVPRPDRISVQTFKPNNVRFSHNIYFAGQGHPTRSATDRVIDPRFVRASTHPEMANFRLQASSPAIDRWIGESPAVDLEKTPRPQGRAADLGAYEYRAR